MDFFNFVSFRDWAKTVKETSNQALSNNKYFQRKKGSSRGQSGP